METTQKAIAVIQVRDGGDWDQDSNSGRGEKQSHCGYSVQMQHMREREKSKACPWFLAWSQKDGIATDWDEEWSRIRLGLDRVKHSQVLDRPLDIQAEIKVLAFGQETGVDV